MSKREIDEALAGAYPLDRAAIEALPLGAADAELLAAIVVEPQELPATGPSERRPARAAARSRLRPRLTAVLTAATAVTAAFLVLTGTGRGPAVTSEPAYAAGFARLAKTAPPILFQAPGWRAVYADLRRTTEGYVEFQVGLKPQEDPRKYAKFRWHAKPVEERAGELASNGALAVATAPVLDTEATIYEYPHPKESAFELVALWEGDGRTFEFRSTVTGRATFERRLLLLHEVDHDRWVEVTAWDIGSTPIRTTLIGPHGEERTISCVHGHPVHSVTIPWFDGPYCSSFVPPELYSGARDRLSPPEPEASI